MSLQTIESYNLESTTHRGFSELDAGYASGSFTKAELAQFGAKIALTDFQILETPEDVSACGEVLTNPSQIVMVDEIVDGERVRIPIFYARREPKTLHLGHTVSQAYALRIDRNSKPVVTEFAGALTIPGEDPRITKGVVMKGIEGKYHRGWCFSSVVATPMPGNPADVLGIVQTIYFGETLATLEKVHEIKGIKNTGFTPLATITGNNKDTRLDTFGRPHPHITNFVVKSLCEITAEQITNAPSITDGYLPHGVHTGVNTPHHVPGRGNEHLRILDTHEAHAEITPEGKKVLHYRLVRLGFDSKQKKVIPLGVLARRSDFPYAEPKPPENGVANYYDIVYGSCGTPDVPYVITGVSDRHIGFARKTF
jgi:hypothetical protein